MELKSTLDKWLTSVLHKPLLTNSQLNIVKYLLYSANCLTNWHSKQNVQINKMLNISIFQVSQQNGKNPINKYGHEKLLEIIISFLNSGIC